MTQLQHYHRDFQALRRTVLCHIPAVSCETKRLYIGFSGRYEKASFSDIALIYMRAQMLR